MNPQVSGQNPTYPTSITISLMEIEMCVYRGDISEIPYMYPIAGRDGGYVGFRGLTCTFTEPCVLVLRWICWISWSDLR